MAMTSEWIVEGTEANFQQVILDGSKTQLRVVVFGAPWDESCVQLAATLDSLAVAANGAFTLVKVDVDQQPNLASAFRVQGIPNVFAVKEGQLIDQFTGLLPADQIQQWLDQFQPSPLEALLSQAHALEKTSAREAEAKYREALELAPQDDAIKIRLAKLLLAQHSDADARTIVAELEARGYLEPEVENIKAELDMRAAAAEAGEVGECRAAIAADPENLALQLKLADALAAVSQYEEALSICLGVAQKSPGELREHARTTMVNIFHLLGAESELATSYRRKLATALY